MDRGYCIQGHKTGGAWATIKLLVDVVVESLSYDCPALPARDPRAGKGAMRHPLTSGQPAAILANCSLLPSPHPYWIATVRPSIHPSSRNLFKNAASRWFSTAGVLDYKPQRLHGERAANNRATVRLHSLTVRAGALRTNVSI